MNKKSPSLSGPPKKWGVPFMGAKNIYAVQLFTFYSYIHPQMRCFDSSDDQLTE